jgi:hypothetical protein
MPKKMIALTTPAVAGSMKALSASSKRTYRPCRRRDGRRAASRDRATRTFSTSPGGACFGPTDASNRCVCRKRAYSPAHPPQLSRCWASARICWPVSAPSRYAENIERAR